MQEECSLYQAAVYSPKNALYVWFNIYTNVMEYTQMSVISYHNPVMSKQ